MRVARRVLTTQKSKKKKKHYKKREKEKTSIREIISRFINLDQVSDQLTEKLSIIH